MGKSQIFELKSQNRDFNSLLCEIFTYMAVKVQKSQTQLFYEVATWLVLDGTTFIRNFVTKTHSFRDKIASGQRSKIPSRTSIMANYMHLKGGKELNIIVIICIYVN